MASVATVHSAAETPTRAHTKRTRQVEGRHRIRWMHASCSDGGAVGVNGGGVPWGRTMGTTAKESIATARRMLRVSPANACVESTPILDDRARSDSPTRQEDRPERGIPLWSSLDTAWDRQRGISHGRTSHGYNNRTCRAPFFSFTSRSRVTHRSTRVARAESKRTRG